jgi:hypothetical protein
MSTRLPDYKPAWVPPQDAAGFCKSHRPAKPSYSGPDHAPIHGPPLPEHIAQAREAERFERQRRALAVKGIRLTRLLR